MREATVADMLSYSGVDPSSEEHLTTSFLNVVQVPKTKAEGMVDPLEMTAEERRMALVWYHVNTGSDSRIPLAWDCDCGERHSFDCDLRERLGAFRPVDGKPFRDAEIDTRKIRVTPISGKAAEILEDMRLDLDLHERTRGRDSDEYRAASSRLIVGAVVLAFHFADEDMSKHFQERLDAREAAVSEMPAAQFFELTRIVSDALHDMRHGLPCVIDRGIVYLLSAPQSCPNVEGGNTALRFRFRVREYLPTILGTRLANRDREPMLDGETAA